MFDLIEFLKINELHECGHIGKQTIDCCDCCIDLIGFLWFCLTETKR